jgi:plasmid maintenance system antidote protein VapI
MALGRPACDTRAVPQADPKRLRCPIDVFRYHDYRSFLAAYYQAKKPRGFSYRAFARAAGLGAPNYLQLVINGRRNLTPAMARRFAETCGLAKDAARYFVALVAFNQATDPEERQARYRELSGFRRYRRAQKLELAEAAYHSTWYLPAIRELVLSPAFQEDPAWIAATLRPPIKESEARQALDTLLELGLLEPTGLHITNYHAEMMRRATVAMASVPAAERDISSLTLCLGPGGLATLKGRIQALRRELLELSESEAEPSQVVQLNFQLFPLSEAALPRPAHPPRSRRS